MNSALRRMLAPRERAAREKCRCVARALQPSWRAVIYGKRKNPAAARDGSEVGGAAASSPRSDLTPLRSDLKKGARYRLHFRYSEEFEAPATDDWAARTVTVEIVRRERGAILERAWTFDRLRYDNLGEPICTRRRDRLGSAGHSRDRSNRAHPLGVARHLGVVAGRCRNERHPHYSGSGSRIGVARQDSFSVQECAGYRRRASSVH